MMRAFSMGKLKMVFCRGCLLSERQPVGKTSVNSKQRYSSYATFLLQGAVGIPPDLSCSSEEF